VAQEAQLFCPNCKLEYRAGFTRCADCDVDLVAALPKPADAQEVGVHDLRSPSVLRRGVSVSDAAVIRDALKAAGIRFNTRRASAEIVADGSASYEFWVNNEDRPNAQSVLEAALEAADANEPLDSTSAHPAPSGGGNSETPAEVDASGPGSDEAPSQDDDLNEFGELDDEELTAVAWSGNAADQADLLKICLREVGIASRVAKNAANVRLLVAEKDAMRSREIVREVIEAAPPE
jgi:hypothetical protein